MVIETFLKIITAIYNKLTVNIITKGEKTGKKIPSEIKDKEKMHNAPFCPI